MEDLRTNKEKHHGIKTCISVVLIIYVLYGLAIYWFNRSFTYPDPLLSWPITEWLINFEGGFVRRGLLGEGIFKFCSTSDISPLYIVSFLTLGIYLSLFLFYLRKFKERRVCWWFLCGPLMFGYLDDILRKDFLMLWLVIITILMLKRMKVPYLLQTLACIVTVFGILVHEAYIFFGAPITILLLRGNGSKTMSVILATIVIAEFALLCYFKGSLSVASGITGSWNNFFGEEILHTDGFNSIGALSWETMQTFRNHIGYNIGESNFCTGFILQIVMALSIYYVTINFMKVFQYREDGFTEEDQTNTGALFMILSVTMLPMFTVLSCDYGRLYQYEVMSIVGMYLIVDRTRLTGLIPSGFRKVSFTVNKKINTIFKPSPAWILGLFMIIGSHTEDFNIETIFSNSILGKLSKLVGFLIQCLLF